MICFSLLVLSFFDLACDRTSPLQELITDSQNQGEASFKDFTVNGENICLLVEAFERDKRQWHRLDLSNNRLGRHNAIYINQILQKSNLSYLHLGGNSLGTEGIRNLSALKDNQHLTELNLSENFINDDGVDILVKILSNTTVRKLNLSNNVIGFKACPILFNQLPSSINDLDLRGNRIPDSCLQPMVNVISKQQLKRLNLENQNGFRWSETE